MKKLIVLLAFASALHAQSQGGGITQPGAGGLPVYPGTGSPAGVSCTAGQAYQYQGTAYLCNGGVFVASSAAFPTQPTGTITGNNSGSTSAPSGLTGPQAAAVISAVTTVQTAKQSLVGQFTTPQLGADLDVDGFTANPATSSGCTLAWYSSDGNTHTHTYFTPFDCAVGTAYLAGHTNSLSTAINLRGATYPTCGGFLDNNVTLGTSAPANLDFDIDGKWAVNLYGSSPSATQIKVVTMTGAAASTCTGFRQWGHLNLITGGSAHPFFMLNVGVNFNNMGGSNKFSGILRGALINDFWDNSTATGNGSAVVLFGDYTGGAGNTFGQVLETSFIGLNARAASFSGSGATATATASAGKLTFAVGAGGSGYFGSNPPMVLISGYGASSNRPTPCTTMPTSITATVTSGAVTAIATSGDEVGCDGAFKVGIFDYAPAANGFYFPWVTDSYIAGMTVRGYGRSCGIAVGSTSGNNRFVSPHAYSFQQNQICMQGNNTYYGIELDQPALVGIRDTGPTGGGSGDIIHGVTIGMANSPLDTAAFYLSSGAVTTSVEGITCLSNLATNYNEFITATGPLGAGLNGAINSSTSITNNYGCSPPTPANYFGSSQSFTGNVGMNYLRFTGSPPTIANGAAAGTSPGTPTFTGTNQAGVITVITGTATTTNATLATIIFNGTVAAAPQGCMLFPRNALSAAAMTTVSTTAPSTTGFTITTGAGALTASSTYSWNTSCF